MSRQIEVDLLKRRANKANVMRRRFLGLRLRVIHVLCPVSLSQNDSRREPSRGLS